MNRREFLQAAAIAGGAIVGGCAVSQNSVKRQAAGTPYTQFDQYFVPILEGFLKNAKATAPDYVVCDYPEGTKLKSCCTPSGKTYVSVARMLPALAEWMSTGRADANVREVVLSVYRNAFDPKNANFWGYGPKERATQLSVEAALVSWALWRLG